ncbi:hypothetical protein AcV5_003388 [Taiwanofungus camphoratus]|nr:hypothetical protein AcV5_003388 [Antrodia cinnamomea]KAI0935104.1 hypothetical protein AcV7_004003 [Antrodia cinnamomea]
MQEAIGVPLSRLATFLQHLRQVYRQGNSYHNFQHALDVFQATYFFLFSAGMVPPVSILSHTDTRTWKRDKDCQINSLISCLTEQDLFALCIAAVGHDVGHPGLTNTFMKNAKTPLAVVYDDKSVLEQMHYSLILQIMRHNGLESLLDRPVSGPSFRKLLLGTVLATDLSLHYEFMANFQELVTGKDMGEVKRKLLVCQAIIKCADISNPSRPYSVSKHWVAALESEWARQSLLEQHLHLPASVKPSDDSLGEARGQVWFIGTFTRPLFELVAQGIPEMEQFARQCRENLLMWETRSAELSANIEQAATTSSAPLAAQWQLVENFLSAFPPTLPESFRGAEDQRTTFSSPACSSTSSASSHYESCESGLPSPSISPSEPVSSVSPLMQPRLEITPSHHRSPSVASTASYSTHALDATAAIRAAYKASVRKKKSFHRSSWNPVPTPISPLSSHLFLHSNVTSPISPMTLTSNSPLTAGSSPSTTHTHSPITPESTSARPRPSPLSAAFDATDIA